jgi:hypothetical protein
MAIVGIIGCPLTAGAVRAVRRQTVDDRPLMMWIWFSGGLDGLLHHLETQNTARLAVGILFLVMGIVSLIQWIRNPKPPGPEPEPSTRAPHPSGARPDRDASPPLGGLFAVGFALLVMAAVSQSFMRQRSLAIFAAMGGLGLSLMLWGSLPRPKRPS